MSLQAFIITTIILIIFHIVLLRNEWKSQFPFIKKACIIYLMVIFTLTIISVKYEVSWLDKMSRYLSIGILSITILIPFIFDQFLRMIAFTEKIQSFSEALVLYRNIMNGTINDFIWGIRTAPKYKKGVRSKIKTLGLISVTLVARIPNISSNLLVTTYVRRFSIDDIKYLKQNSYRPIIILMVGILYFVLVLFGDKLWA